MIKSKTKHRDFREHFEQVFRTVTPSSTLLKARSQSVSAQQQNINFVIKFLSKFQYFIEYHTARYYHLWHSGFR